MGSGEIMEAQLLRSTSGDKQMGGQVIKGPAWRVGSGDPGRLIIFPGEFNSRTRNQSVIREWLGRRGVR